MREDRTVVIGTANKIALNFYKRIKCQVFIREWNVTMFHCSLQGGERIPGRQRMRWLDGITDSMDTSFSELRDGQGGLAGCSPRGLKESDATERRNSNNIWTSLSGTAALCCRKEGSLSRGLTQTAGEIRQLKPAAEGVWTATSALEEGRKEALELVLNGASKAPPQTCWVKNPIQVVKTVIHFFFFFLVS